MKTIYHLKDASSIDELKGLPKAVIQSILLDLFWIDTKRMGKRAKLCLLDSREKSEYSPNHLRFGETIIENYTRTLYLYHRSTNVCEYKRKEK